MKNYLVSWRSWLLPGMIIFVIHSAGNAQPVIAPAVPENIRQNLKPDEVMLAYFLTDSSVQVNAVTVDSTLLASQSLNPLFWESMKSFRKKLMSADPNEFSILGQVLYLFLVDPVKELLPGKRRLIIIPDERLTGLPFEAFVLNDAIAPPYNICNIHYLIRDFEIVYHCSPLNWSTLACEVNDEHESSPDDHRFAFMGFSPVFSDYPGVSPLPGSKMEINEIGSLFRQKGLSRWLVSGRNSDKEYFKSVAGRGKIVHLATHFLRDVSDPRNEGFLFWGYDSSGKNGPPDNGILSVDEIPKLRLQADLIVLNTCSSGIEKQKSGDTVCSLPCVFFLAGARNVLSTLWSVNDKLAGSFMVSFYRIWLSGKSFSESLREVKLHMISCPETALPTIWAPYVLTGR
ncbi:MAG: CHAT domain-containing protein [Bacteroidota bacterium]